MSETNLLDFSNPTGVTEEMPFTDAAEALFKGGSNIEAETEEVPEEAPEQEPEAEETEEAEEAEDTPDEEESEEDDPSEDIGDYSFKVEGQEEEVVITQEDLQHVLKLRDSLGGSLKDAESRSLMHSDYTKKTQATAQEKKDLQGQYAQKFQDLDQLTAIVQGFQTSEGQEFQGVDWEKLRDSEPTKFEEDFPRFLKFQDKQKNLDQIVQLALTEQSKLQEEQMTSHIAEQLEMAKVAIPELNDQERANTFQKEVSDYLDGLGFTPEEKRILDHRQLLILKDAIAGKSFKEAGKKIAKSKISKSPTRVIKKGTPQTKKVTKSKVRQAKEERLNKEQSLASAADLIFENQGLG